MSCPVRFPLFLSSSQGTSKLRKIKNKNGIDSRNSYVPKRYTKPKNTSKNQHLLLTWSTFRLSSPDQMIPTNAHFNSLKKSNIRYENNTDLVKNIPMPTMTEVLAASKAQKLDLQLQTLGPFSRITAKSLETQHELGRAEGLIRVWLNGKILHLDSIRLRRETLGMEKSIFGIGLFIGAVAIRYWYDCGCKTAELLAINDSDLYHSKLVRFYSRIGFNSVYEVTGSSIRDLPHMLVWGSIGTRMDADVEELLIKWCARFKSRE